MSNAIPFIYKEGAVNTAETTYLPYATRTLAIRVTNGTDKPVKLWLRPVNVPESFPEAAVHGYGGIEGQVESDLLVHWGGGDKSGACVKMTEIDLIKDKSLEVWKVKPVELEPNEGNQVYLNVTHQSGEVRSSYNLSLAVVTKDDDDKEQVLNGRLNLTLTPPSEVLADPVRGVWRQDGSLVFIGTQLLDYLPRWHTSNDFELNEAGDLLGRISFQSDGRWIRASLDDSPLMEVEDLEWDNRDGSMRDLTSISPCLPELYHLCDGRYYALRVWFLWVNRLIGDKHEVPDAERFDVFFDSLKKKVLYVGTDFHYKELWGEPVKPERGVQARLGLKVFKNLGDFKKTLETVNRAVGKSENPSKQLMNELCGVGPTGKVVRGGTAAHVPLLRQVLFELTSEDVREL